MSHVRVRKGVDGGMVASRGDGIDLSHPGIALLVDVFAGVDWLADWSREDNS